ncbi:MAG: nitroreductase family protein [Armatimonadota bacterium]|nr:nitroreductase family protein [bacterium]
MELRDVIQKRASVRHFNSDAVPEEHLREMVRLAGLAPSVNNSQPWKFIVITNRELLRKMADTVHSAVETRIPICDNEAEKHARAQVEWFSTFFGEAPAVIAVAQCPYTAIVDSALEHSNMTHEDINALRGHPDIESVGAAVEHIILAAVDMGYGACWLSGPLIARESLEEQLGLCDSWCLAAMVAVGKPEHDVLQKEKKPIEEIFELRS